MEAMLTVATGCPSVNPISQVQAVQPAHTGLLTMAYYLKHRCTLLLMSAAT